MTRRQCAKCPWKKSVDPYEIPTYDVKKHEALSDTIAAGIGSIGSDLRVMACHESKTGDELPCVGWVHNQLGVGNNIGLRLAAASGRIDVNMKIVGEQHERFEDTLPQRRRR